MYSEEQTDDQLEDFHEDDVEDDADVDGEKPTTAVENALPAQKGISNTPNLKNEATPTSSPQIATHVSLQTDKPVKREKDSTPVKEVLLSSLGVKKRKISELKDDQKVVPHVQKLLLQGPLESGLLWTKGAMMDHNTLAALRFREDVLIKLDFVIHHCSSCDHLEVVEESDRNNVHSVVEYLRGIQKYLNVVSELQQASEALPQPLAFLNKSLDHHNYNSSSYKAFCAWIEELCAAANNEQLLAWTHTKSHKCENKK